MPRACSELVGVRAVKARGGSRRCLRVWFPREAHTAATGQPRCVVDNTWRLHLAYAVPLRAVLHSDQCTLRVWCSRVLCSLILYPPPAALYRVSGI